MISVVSCLIGMFSLNTFLRFRSYETKSEKFFVTLTVKYTLEVHSGETKSWKFFVAVTV